MPQKRHISPVYWKCKALSTSALTLMLLVFFVSAQSQSLVYQDSLYSEFNCAIPNAQGGLILAGSSEEPTYLRLNSLMSYVNDSLNEHLTAVLPRDSGEISQISRIHQLPSGRIITAGIAISSCILGYESAELRKVQDTVVTEYAFYTTGGQYSFALSDERLAIGFADSVIILDTSFVEVSRFSLPMSQITELYPVTNGLLAQGGNSLFLLDSSFSIVNSLNGISPRIVLPLSNGNFTCWTTDSVLMLNSNLQRTGYGSSLPWSNFNGLIELDSNVMAYDQNVLIYLSDTMSIDSSHSLSLPLEFELRGIIDNTNTLVAFGSYRTLDITSACALNIAPDGSTQLPVSDIELSDILVDTFFYSTSIVAPGVYHINALVEGRYQVRNNGSDTIEAFTLNKVLISNSPWDCGEIGTVHHIDTTIAPGQSVWVEVNDTRFWATMSSPGFPPYCAFVATPDNRIESDLSNNELCVPIYIPLSIVESDFSHMQIHPNPASDFVILGIANLDELVSTEIIDMQGHVVRSFGNESRLDIRGLSPALYLVRTKSKSAILHSRLIVE